MRLAALFVLLLGLALPGRAGEHPMARGRGVIEALLGNIDPALPLPDAPPPAPVQAADPAELKSAAAKAVLEQLRDLSRRTPLRGYEYFSKHPDSPVPAVSFKDPLAQQTIIVNAYPEPREYPYGGVGRWYPYGGPLRVYRTTYFPAKGETHAPLTNVELELDERQYERLFQDAEQAYGPGFFKDEKAAASRLALFLAPRAAADLEMSRLMDELDIPDGIWVDGIEDLRLFWEVAALRGQFALQEAMLGGADFKLLPAERDYLIQRFDDETLEAFLTPRNSSFSGLAARELESISNWGELGLVPILKADRDDNLRRAESLRAEIVPLLRGGGGRPKPHMLCKLLQADYALAYLSKPGAIDELRRALNAERGRIRIPPARDDPAAGLFILRKDVAEAVSAGKKFDLEGLESRVDAAGAVARRYHLNFDPTATRQALKARYFTLERGLELYRIGDLERRRTVLRSFGGLGLQARDAVPFLQDVLVGRDWQEVRVEAAAALGKMGSEGIPALVLGLDENNPSVRETVVESMVGLGPAGIPALAAALDDSPNYRSNRMTSAAEALGRIGAPAVPACVALLKRQDRLVRLYALRALESMGPAAKSALPALREFLESAHDPGVRKQAERTLLEILR